MDPKGLGRRIAAARVLAGLTQDELASMLEYDRGTLSRTENGTRQPKKMELWAIAEFCDVPREFFTAEFSDLALLPGVARELADLEERLSEIGEAESLEGESREEAG